MADKRRQRGSQPVRFLILALVLAVLVGVGSVWGKSMLTAAGALTSGGATTIPSSLYSPTPEAGGPGGDGVVGLATPAPDSTTPADPAAVASRIASAGTQPGTLGASAVDLTSGRVLYSKNPTTLMTPASNLKVLTMMSLLNVESPGTTYSTKVVEAQSSSATPASPAGTASSASSGTTSITLVGGGDPYLQATPSATEPSFASTQRLAASTAAALKKQGVSSVRLSYDDTLFGTDSWAATWPASYADQVTRISSLWVDEGMADGSSARSTTPALQAATTFAAQLGAAGITVTGEPSAAKAPAGATSLAQVSSAPLETLIKTALLHSDNSATEVLGRQLAIASGHPATFAGAAAAVRAQLTRMGIWQNGAVLQDTCGLSRGDLVSAEMLVKGWQHALTTERIEPIADALPVARVSGSLTTRFGEAADVAGRGVVHAKTGTLTGVSALSGWVRTADGRVVIQATILNNAPDNAAATAWLDAEWSAVASS